MNSTIYIVGLVVATVFFIVGYFSLREVCLASPVQVMNLADVAAQTHSGHSRPNPGLQSNGFNLQRSLLPLLGLRLGWSPLAWWARYRNKPLTETDHSTLTSINADPLQTFRPGVISISARDANIEASSK